MGDSYRAEIAKTKKKVAKDARYPAARYREASAKRATLRKFHNGKSSARRDSPVARQIRMY